MNKTIVLPFLLLLLLGSVSALGTFKYTSHSYTTDVYKDFGSNDFCLVDGSNCAVGNSTGGNSSWNQTLANTLYYPRNTNPLGYLNTSGGGNTSWNQTYANTLYYAIGNPSGYITDGNTNWDNTYGFITGYNETDPLWSGNASLYYLKSNPLSFYNASTIPAYLTSEALWQGNSTLYYLKSNPLSFYNSSTIPAYLLSYTETDPLWTNNQSLYYLKSNPLGYYNSTTLPASGSGDNSGWSNTTGTIRLVDPTMNGSVGISAFNTPALTWTNNSWAQGNLVGVSYTPGEFEPINTELTGDGTLIVNGTIITSYMSTETLYLSDLFDFNGANGAMNAEHIHLNPDGDTVGSLVLEDSIGGYLFEADASTNTVFINDQIHIGNTTGTPMMFVNSTSNNIGFGMYPDQNLGNQVVEYNASSVAYSGTVYYYASSANADFSTDLQVAYISDGGVYINGNSDGRALTVYSNVGGGDKLFEANTVADTLLIHGQEPCLADGTNCPTSSGGNSSWNQTLANTLYYPLNTNPLVYYNASTALTTVEKLWHGNSTLYATTASLNAPSGWVNSTTQVQLTNNNTNISIGNVNGLPVLFLDTTNGRLGVGTNALTATNHWYFNSSEDANNVLLINNADYNGLTTAAVLRVQTAGAVLNFQAHGPARTISRWGVTLANWTEFLTNSPSDGLAIGSSVNIPVILGTNGARSIYIDGDTQNVNLSANLTVNGQKVLKTWVNMSFTNITNTGTKLNNINELAFAVEQGYNYTYNCDIYYASNTTTTGIRFALNYSGTAPTRANLAAEVFGVSATAVNAGVARAMNTVAVTSTAVTTANVMNHAQLTGTIITGAGDATIFPQYASETAAPPQVTIIKDSTCNIMRFS